MIRKIARIGLAFFLIIACFFWSESPSFATITFSWSFTQNPCKSTSFAAQCTASLNGYTISGTAPNYTLSWTTTISSSTGINDAGGFSYQPTYKMTWDCGSGEQGLSTRTAQGSNNADSIPNVACTQPLLRFYVGVWNKSTGITTYPTVGGTPTSSLSMAPPPPVTAGACVLTASQLAMVARGAGFTDSNGPTAVAIAMAESGGRVGALHQNTNPITFDIGLWQINDAAHPSYDRDRLRAEPTYNATTALAIYTAASNSFSPWATFNSGAYLANMDKARSAWVNSAPATIISSSCNGLTADPSGTTVTDANDATDNCGFSVNPVTWMKCLFVPTSGSLQGWSSHVDSIKANPPASLVSSGYSYANNFIDQARCGDADFNTVGNCHLEDLRFNTTLQGHNILFDPLGGAESVHSSTGAVIIRTFSIVALWGWFGFWAWHRVADSLGAKAKTS